jgi:hypothetical protein
MLWQAKVDRLPEDRTGRGVGVKLRDGSRIGEAATALVRLFVRLTG